MPTRMEYERDYARERFPLTKKIDGKIWTVYSGGKYDTEEAAEEVAIWMRADGYQAKVFRYGEKYLIAWKNRMRS